MAIRDFSSLWGGRACKWSQRCREGRELSFASLRQVLPVSQQEASSNSAQPGELCLQQLFPVVAVVGNQEINRLCSAQEITLLP